MAHTRTWDAAYEADPSDSDDISGGADQIRDAKTDIRERMEIDHYMDVAGTDADHGEHAKITFHEPISTPTDVANKCFLYGKDVGGKVELHFLDEDGNEIQLTTSGGLNQLTFVEYFGSGYIARPLFSKNDGDTLFVEPGCYAVKEKEAKWDIQITTGNHGVTGADFAFLYLDYSAITSGTLIANNTPFIWDATPPTWNDEHKGWYGTGAVTATTDDRCIFACYIEVTTDDIVGFYHDGGRLVQYDESIVDRSVADIAHDWSTTQALTIPDICTKAQVTFRWIYSSHEREAYWRPGDSSGAGHIIGTVNANSRKCDVVADVFTDSSLQIDVRDDDSSSNTMAINTMGYHLPRGL